MKKILLITPSSIQVIIFRANLIKELQKNGYSVSVLTFDDKEKERIDELGVDFNCIEDSNRSLNPFKVLSLSKRYKEKIKSINPDIVFTFMLKPNAFGVVAAKKAGVKEIYSMVEGAGDVFINQGLKWKIIKKFVCALYKRAFKISKKVFFLNNDDKNEFINLKLVKPEQCEIIRGVGINTEKFSFSEPTSENVFLMVSRLLKTKGVMDYLQAAKIVKEKYPQATFNLVGAEGNITKEDIKGYTEDGTVNYMGVTSDVIPYYRACNVNVLPSFREGFGLVLAEAGAIGRMSISYNAVGTKDVIVDGETGFLVEKRNVKALAEKMIWCIENPEKVIEMGKNAHDYALENFDYRVINERILAVLDGVVS